MRAFPSRGEQIRHARSRARCYADEKHSMMRYSLECSTSRLRSSSDSLPCVWPARTTSPSVTATSAHETRCKTHDHRVELAPQPVAPPESALTNEDFEELRRLGNSLSDVASVGVLSPLRKRSRRPPWRRAATSEFLVFPNATALPRRDWDLNEPGDRRFEMLVASDVFMYSPDPGRWFRHVLAACRCFLMIDLVRRRRSEDSEFGPDGDCMRYAIGGDRPRVEPHFDLAGLGDKLLGCRTYYGGANEFDDEPLHVVALLRGDLAITSTSIQSFLVSVSSGEGPLAPV